MCDIPAVKITSLKSEFPFFQTQMLPKYTHLLLNNKLTDRLLWNVKPVKINPIEVDFVWGGGGGGEWGVISNTGINESSVIYIKEILRWA